MAEEPNMSVTLAGILLTALGHASRQWIDENWRTRQDAWANLAINLRHTHPGPIILDTAHDGQRIGDVLGLHLAPGRGGIEAWAVAEVEAPGANRLLEYDEPLYLSGLLDARVKPNSAVGDDIVVLSVGITTEPAQVSARP
jgi:hypothetical protein